MKPDGCCEWGICENPKRCYLIPRDIEKAQAGTPKQSCGVHLFRLMTKMLNAPGVAFVDVCRREAEE